MLESIKSRRVNKPTKPNAGFPLFAHQNGQWAKKVRAKLHYFGPWRDAAGARMMSTATVAIQAQNGFKTDMRDSSLVCGFGALERPAQICQ